MIGSTLGHYRILEELGSGGMGVVYRALDTHLDRPVAIKVLRAGAAASPDRKRRFAQEARAASALNHPNILHVYDIDSQDEVDFIAMEYVAGKTLDRLIERKGLSLKHALEYGVRIADALARAHAAGIVHRDLKPANIMVSDQGLVKMLDFGLAKLFEPAESDPQAVTATIQADRTPQTAEGTIVGTAAYMSPEQAEGRPLDPRTDIFSFGSVLYEMVTGRRAFQGPTSISVLSAILEKDPQPISGLAPHAPPELERVIARCLKKDPARRFQTAADLKVALQELQEESESGRLTAPAVNRPGRRSIRAPLTLGIVAAVAMIVVWILARNRQPAAAPGLILTQLTFDAGLTTDPALSRDGKLVAYASDRGGGGNLDIWVQQLAGRQAIQLTEHPSDDHEASFSPDGANLVFRSERDGGGIYLVSTLGGAERLLAPLGRGPRFSPDGSRVAYWVGNIGGDPTVPGTSKIYVIEVGRSAPGAARQVAREFAAARYPVWSPDGEALLFWGIRDAKAGNSPDWWVAPLDGTPPTPTGAASSFDRQRLAQPPGSYMIQPAEWLGAEAIFSARFGDSTNLWRIALSRQDRQAGGEARRLTFGSGLETQAAAASGGLFAFASLVHRLDIWSLPINANTGKPGGEMVRLTDRAGANRSPTVSEDGSLVAYYADTSSTAEVRLRNIATGKDTLLGEAARDGLGPAIKPDRTGVAYPVTEEDRASIYAVPPTGGVPERLCTDCRAPYSFTPDGKQMLFWPASATPATVALLDLASGTKQAILRRPGWAIYRSWFSPDGRWIAFHARNRPGRSQLFVAPFRGAAAIPEQDWIPVTGDESYDLGAKWAPDGGILYFLSERDGFRCIWAQRLDEATKRAAGPPFPIAHFHAATRSMMHLATSWLGVSVARDKLVFNVGDITGNVWLARPSETK